MARFNAQSVSRFAIVAAVFAVGVFATALAQATVVVGSDVFSEEFNGSAIDSGVWESVLVGAGSITVDGGSARFRTASAVTPQDDAWITTLSGNPFDFSSSPNEWGAEAKFTVNALATTSSSRQYLLLNGLSTLTTSEWTNQGFDLRLSPKDSTHFNLVWNGWDNDGARVPITLGTGYAEGVSHIAKVHRKTDNTVDVYMDDAFVSNQPLIGGVNPAQLRIGDIARYITGDFVIDYVKVGEAVPEPASMVLTMTAIMGLLAYAWRKRK